MNTNKISHKPVYHNTHACDPVLHTRCILHRNLTSRHTFLLAREIAAATARKSCRSPSATRRSEPCRHPPRMLTLRCSPLPVQWTMLRMRVPPARRRCARQASSAAVVRRTQLRAYGEQNCRAPACNTVQQNGASEQPCSLLPGGLGSAAGPLAPPKSSMSGSSRSKSSSHERPGEVAAKPRLRLASGAAGDLLPGACG
jgi:hypothetical protein